MKVYYIWKGGLYIKARRVYSGDGFTHSWLSLGETFGAIADSIRSSVCFIIGPNPDRDSKVVNMVLRVWKQNGQWLLARLDGTRNARAYSSFDRAAEEGIAYIRAAGLTLSAENVVMIGPVPDFADKVTIDPTKSLPL